MQKKSVKLLDNVKEQIKLGSNRVYNGNKSKNGQCLQAKANGLKPEADERKFSALNEDVVL